jgi:multidrug efflux pump subunit AcrB
MTLSEEKPAHPGLAGRLAATFVNSKLTVLFVLASLLLGVFAAVRLPREEEPQINVPMFDVFVGVPGASAREVEDRVTRLGERKFWEIPGVEYVYSTSEPGLALFILRFKVGTNPEEAMTRVYTKTFAHMDMLPPGATQPLIKPRSIDDVPILSLNLTNKVTAQVPHPPLRGEGKENKDFPSPLGRGQGEGLELLPKKKNDTLMGKGRISEAQTLRRTAAALREEISAVPGVSTTDIIGGRRRQFLVHFDPEALAKHHLTPMELAGTIQAANTRVPAGTVNRDDRSVAVETDALIRTANDLRDIVVGVSAGRAVTLADVATVTDGPDEDERAVTEWARDNEPADAVTLAVSKRRGENATVVAREVLRRLDALQPLLGPDTKIAITRNYGETAKEKSDELLYHMALATLSVTLLIALFLGCGKPWWCWWPSR